MSTTSSALPLDDGFVVRFGQRPSAPPRRYPRRPACPSHAPASPRATPGRNAPSDEMTSEDQHRAAAHERDLRFVQRILRREPAALEEMGARLACLPAMLRHQSRRLGAQLSEHELEEVAQDTVVALWSKLSTYEGRATLETWAFRFATLQLLKLVQRRARRPRPALIEGEELELPAPEPEEDALPFDAQEVRAELGRLSAPAAAVIGRRHDEGQSFEEIAAAEGLPVNTVKARYYRGLARLREHLERRLAREERA